MHKLGIEAHAYAHYTSLLCFIVTGKLSIMVVELHVARNAPPPAIGVILHEEVCQLLVKTRQDKSYTTMACVKR